MFFNLTLCSCVHVRRSRGTKLRKSFLVLKEKKLYHHETLDIIICFSQL